MPTPRELLRARRDQERAELTTILIEKLPRRIGATFEWRNGVRWVRIGGDAWLPDYELKEPTGTRPFSSAHVATRAGTWLPKRLK